MPFTEFQTGDLGYYEVEDKEKKISTDTMTENNLVKSDNTNVQIFKYNFYPFWIVCSKNMFTNLFFIDFCDFVSPVLSGANDPKWCFMYVLQFFYCEKRKKCLHSY